MFSFLYGIDHNIDPVQGSAGIATVSTIADKDSYIIDFLPLGNYGSEEEFWVIWDLAVLKGKRTAFLHFPFTDKPDNVIKVEIRIYFEIHIGPVDFQIFTVNVDWGEDTINWFNAPIGETFILKDEISENGFYTFDVTDFIQGEDGFSILIHDPTINNAKFRNEAGDVGPVNDSIQIIYSQPFDTIIKINNGSDNTYSMFITLDITAELAQEMCFRNGTDGVWTSWEPYNTTKNLYLEGSEEGQIYSIYAKFRNIFGETQPKSDDIIYAIYREFWNNEIDIELNELNIILTIIFIGGLVIIAIMVKKGR
ncbi:unnamed protein product [marine sediment metagenome]|uniref:Carbohydrate-binding module family 96 domain-containing protein n=1 Tax=marine sediment metagenome TaxID=412755 RepID=X1ADI7_9ZZZZ